MSIYFKIIIELTFALDEDGTALLDSAGASLGEMARTGDTPLLPDCPPEPPAVGLISEAVAAAFAPGDCRILPDRLVTGGLSGLLAANAFLHLSRWSTILLWVVLKLHSGQNTVGLPPLSRSSRLNKYIVILSHFLIASIFFIPCEINLN